MTQQTARWTLPYLDIETPLARRGFCSNPILSVTLVGYQAQDLRSQPWNIFTIWDCEICQRQIIVIYWFRYKLRFLLWKENHIKGLIAEIFNRQSYRKEVVVCTKGLTHLQTIYFMCYFNCNCFKNFMFKNEKFSLWKSAPLRAALKTHGFN